MCEVTAGYTKVCDVAGGVDTLYWFSLRDASGTDNIDTLTVVDGEVTALTLAIGKKAYALNVEQESAQFNDNGIGSIENGSAAYEIEGTAVAHGNTKEMIVNFDNAQKSRLVVIAQLNDDTYEIFGTDKGLKCLKARATGQAYDDLNGNTLNFSGRSKTPAYKIDAAIVASLLVPAS